MFHESGHIWSFDHQYLCISRLQRASLSLGNRRPGGQRVHHRAVVHSSIIVLAADYVITSFLV